MAAYGYSVETPQTNTAEDALITAAIAAGYAAFTEGYACNYGQSAHPLMQAVAKHRRCHARTRFEQLAGTSRLSHLMSDDERSAAQALRVAAIAQ